MRTIRKNSKELQAILADTNIKWLCHDGSDGYIGRPCTPGTVKDQIERFHFSRVTQFAPSAAPIDYIVKITSDFWYQGLYRDPRQTQTKTNEIGAIKCYDLDSFYRIDVPLFPKTIMPLVRELLWFIIDNAEKEIE